MISHQFGPGLLRRFLQDGIGVAAGIDRGVEVHLVEVVVGGRRQEQDRFVCPLDDQDAVVRVDGPLDGLNQQTPGEPHVFSARSRSARVVVVALGSSHVDDLTVHVQSILPSRRHGHVFGARQANLCPKPSRRPGAETHGCDVVHGGDQQLSLEPQRCDPIGDAGQAGFQVQLPAVILELANVLHFDPEVPQRFVGSKGSGGLRESLQAERAGFGDSPFQDELLHLPQVLGETFWICVRRFTGPETLFVQL
jgi:hypothetical protein